MTGEAELGLTDLDLTDEDRVDPGERREVLALAGAAEATDTTQPLDDQVRLDLQYGEGAPVRHLLVRSPAERIVVGYAHLDLRDSATTTAHVVVAPSHRRRGIGRSLVEAAAARDAARHLQVWAHGDLEAARALAAELGLSRGRELWQMGRDLTTALPSPRYPADVQVRTFRPGRDEPAWVEVNARAFSHHPEQGRVTAADVRQRAEQPWFDPAGFFLAERDGVLLGSHWTKVHEAQPGEEAFGEVYVVGVDPSAQGLGLGKALTLSGLHHLRDRGLRRVTLYVDGDNAAARATYLRLGFSDTTVDVLYERRAADPAGTPRS